MRTGNEPSTARSPLRMRLWLSIWGTAWATFGLIAFLVAERPGWAAACGVLLLITVTDFFLVIRRMRQGPRYQPGRDVPPYDPEDPAPPHEGEDHPRDAEGRPRGREDRPRGPGDEDDGPPSGGRGR
ncbi:DUF6343 family protein [Streptomyces halstedii]|uniref:DUF6343 family protein n=1 Tax=Streptomyces halstedii TaxID=1944 RepID=UPI0037F1E6E8